MSGSNLIRFYCNGYQKGLDAFKAGSTHAAEEKCCQLVTAYECPRLIQVQAYQLRSLCAFDYWVFKGRLQSAFDLIAGL
ncbi:hypothetical protein B0A55_00431 [Friedmanniomyces simplex]|uniref:Uncharacterized protein n=1 Tax=Friedmanniomyces simplex TaxID=329884 RepID=A0A4U0Y469_9PEZI|nr:hypothetical protein B0A55_00431 [Friedmanniomyces simplex]